MAHYNIVLLTYLLTYSLFDNFSKACFLLYILFSGLSCTTGTLHIALNSASAHFTPNCCAIWRANVPEQKWSLVHRRRLNASCGVASVWSSFGYLCIRYPLPFSPIPSGSANEDQLRLGRQR